mmetsp:Transcript_796/g.1411  ORF Transcript_796/g.1411 Transcript_796/m.1411 type:complete len:205 (-) Transcript_796:552-1166(-)
MLGVAILPAPLLTAATLLSSSVFPRSCTHFASTPSQHSLNGFDFFKYSFLLSTSTTAPVIGSLHFGTSSSFFFFFISSSSSTFFSAAFFFLSSSSATLAFSSSSFSSFISSSTFFSNSTASSPNPFSFSSSSTFSSTASSTASSPFSPSFSTKRSIISSSPPPSILSSSGFLFSISIPLVKLASFLKKLLLCSMSLLSTSYPKS